MVNWNDPATIDSEDFALVKFMNVIGGIYIWEFLSHFNFEYSVFTRKRKFTWSFLLYLGCRWFPLFVIVSQFVSFDADPKVDCQAWLVSSFSLGYLTFVFESALIILRVAILWDRNKIIMAVACAVWLANIGIYAYTSATMNSSWDGVSCMITNTEHSNFNIISSLITDIFLLVLMLIGLMRWKSAPRSWGIWRLLRIQGLAWVAIVTLGEIPATVFILLNLNAPMNLFFQLLALTASTLGATRLYRGLVDSPALNNSSRVVSSDNGWTNRGFGTLNSSSHSGYFGHSVPKQSHGACSQAEGGSVELKLNIPQGTTSGSRAQTPRPFDDILNGFTRQ